MTTRKRKPEKTLKCASVVCDSLRDRLELDRDFSASAVCRPIRHRRLTTGHLERRTKSKINFLDFSLGLCELQASGHGVFMALVICCCSLRCRSFSYLSGHTPLDIQFIQIIFLKKVKACRPLSWWVFLLSTSTCVLEKEIIKVLE